MTHGSKDALRYDQLSRSARVNQLTTKSGIDDFAFRLGECAIVIALWFDFHISDLHQAAFTEKRLIGTLHPIVTF